MNSTRKNTINSGHRNELQLGQSNNKILFLKKEQKNWWKLIFHIWILRELSTVLNLFITIITTIKRVNLWAVKENMNASQKKLFTSYIKWILNEQFYTSISGNINVNYSLSHAKHHWNKKTRWRWKTPWFLGHSSRFMIVVK